MTRALWLPALVALVANSGVSGSVLAGNGVWTLTGPVGGDVLSLATDPGDPKVLYAGTPAGVFKSTDGASTWALHASGFGVREVNSVAVSAGPDRTIYAGTARSEVYRSTDGGLTWASRSAGLPERCWVARVVVDPRTPLVLYVSLVDSWRPVYKSTDGGASWLPASGNVPGWPFLLPQELALDPVEPDRLYFATTSGVFVSSNGGWSWSAKNQGLPTSQGASEVAVLPALPRTLLAGVGDKLYRSVDGAESWTALGTTGGSFEVIAVDARAPAVVFAGLGLNGGLRRSTDGGLTFGPTSLAGESVRDLVFNRDAVSTLYVASESGVFSSTDSGATFSASSTGLLAPSLRQLAVSPSQPDWLYTVSWINEDRVYRSTDGGGTFEDATGNLPRNGSVPFRRLAVHPTDPMTVFLAGPFEGAAKTTDGGATWGPLGVGLPGPADLIVVHPGSPSILLAGFSSIQPARSTDGGGTWSFAGAGIPGGVRTLAFHPTDPDVAWAGWSGATYRTTDGGAHWIKSASHPNDSFDSLVVDPLDPSRLFASSFTGIFGSEDSGATWTRVDGSVPASHRGGSAMALDPVNPSHLFYSTNSPPAVVYRSLDGGRIWIRAGLEGLTVTGPLVAVSGTVRAATAGGLASLTGAIPFGDLNQDAAVDVFDVVTLASHIVGNVVNGQPPFLGPLAVADENRDFLVDVFDLVILQAFVVGNVSSLPQ